MDFIKLKSTDTALDIADLYFENIFMCYILPDSIEWNLRGN